MSEPDKGKGESAGGVRDVHFRGGGFNPGRRPAAAWVAFALLPAFWQAGSSLGRLSDIILPSPAQIGAEYGIGALVLAAGNLMQTDLLPAGVVMLSLLGLSIGFVLTALC